MTSYTEYKLMEARQLIARKEMRCTRVRQRWRTSSYSGRDKRKSRVRERGDRRRLDELSGDEKTTEEQLNNATSPHSSILYCPLILLGV